MDEFKIKFRGVRGSYPVADKNFLKYGGNTACVEVHAGDHLIILDAGDLDSLKGLELCKKIRQNPDFNRTKLIVTSILHDKELILNTGADLYIPKPYEISGLIKWIETLLRH